MKRFPFGPPPPLPSDDATRYRNLVSGLALIIRPEIHGIPEGSVPDPDNANELLRFISSIRDTYHPAVSRADLLRADEEARDLCAAYDSADFEEFDLGRFHALTDERFSNPTVQPVVLNIGDRAGDGRYLEWAIDDGSFVYLGPDSVDPRFRRSEWHNPHSREADRRTRLLKYEAHLLAQPGIERRLFDLRHAVLGQWRDGAPDECSVLHDLVTSAVAERKVDRWQEQKSLAAWRERQLRVADAMADRPKLDQVQLDIFGGAA